ncbi:site-specific integrase [Ancylobacter radicis]|uniref:Tyrosine-type recombinase/integrase n=1 Tax=Ancylobacter radicis TaxID=2836179 RepID=A0ABS5RDK1_9HYPH|nr:site-specific integrase [Ancylobacter radicis]MBS9478996.1 tyrosine-type recombinase/integrase [Ancylobacter radicis]
MSEEPGPATIWERLGTLAEERAKAGKPLDWFATELNEELLREGLTVDESTRARLMVEADKAFLQSTRQLKRNAQGDYRPDPEESRFPEWVPPSAPEQAAAATPATPIMELFEGYLRELRASGKGNETERRWTPVLRAFIAFVEHDDASRVTKEDVIRWKDERLGVRSPKTVRDTEIAALRAVFGWAVDNAKLAENPAKGVKVRLTERPQSREKGFTNDEASAILKAARDYQKPPREYAQTAAAKRWAPWLCAYSGARIAEITQLRKEDIRQADGIWYMRITPDAGSVKTRQYRDVPLHEHVIAEGFLRFVEASQPGPLFFVAGERTSNVHPSKQVAQQLVEWLRDLGIIGQDVKPNHGWRHTRKTIGRELGLNPRVLDAIEGHASRTAGDDYGDVTLKAKALAVSQYPRFKVG